MDTKRRARYVVDCILGDLTDRCGFDNLWCDMDDDVRDEIVAEWTSRVEEAIKKFDTLSQIE